MTIQEYLPYIIQAASTIAAFAFFLGRYKAMFDHQNKILDSHEKAISSIVSRLDVMNNEFSYMKGWAQRGEKV